MSTIESNPAVDPQEQADHEAAERLFIEGKPFPPDLARRIQERAARIREEIFQRVGGVDVDKLIHESRDER
ncbi:MAG TPA: hypothetical protein VGP68_02880 [Gemmataceae bacterium]|jgi:hypothetical protein|nr:hypothetical protein [Gemmataceae bacterium]